MKYQVIGWTFCDDPAYPEKEDVTPCVEQAICEELKRHGYCFGGDKHEQYCPVLNDGTLVSFSWRGWGRIMGMAKGTYAGGYDYMGYYMDELIPPPMRHYPALGVDDSRIVSKNRLRETFFLHVEDGPYFAIREGTKCFELRLFDEKRRHIDAGDTIIFIRKGHEEERVIRAVTGTAVAPDFETLFSEEFLSRNKMPADPVYYGGAPEDAPASLAASMGKYYTEAQQKKDGVMAIRIGLPAHSCETSLRIVFSDEFEAESYAERVAAFDPHAARKHRGYELGLCDAYDPDVNVMIRKTLANFFGREEELKALKEDSGCKLYLEIVPWIVKGSEEPAPLLSLDPDIIEFLYRAQIRHDLDYYVI